MPCSKYPNILSEMGLFCSITKLWPVFPFSLRIEFQVFIPLHSYMQFDLSMLIFIHSANCVTCCSTDRSNEIWTMFPSSFFLFWSALILFFESLFRMTCSVLEFIKHHFSYCINCVYKFSVNLSSIKIRCDIFMATEDTLLNNLFLFLISNGFLIFAFHQLRITYCPRKFYSHIFLLVFKYAHYVCSCVINKKRKRWAKIKSNKTEKTI